MTARRVLVVGGGITGLAGAVELVETEGLEVELWEAAPNLGGKITTSPFAGLDHVDEAADAYLTRVPDASEFAARVGLAPTDLTAPTEATALVWHDRLHEVPGGIVLGVPASVAPFVRTSLLSTRGKLRAAAEPFLPRTEPDDSLGALVRARFGDEVHERLVDALVGSIYATDTDRSSLAAVPQLAGLAARHRSLLLGARATRRAGTVATGPAAIFGAPRAGMGMLVDATARHAAARGATITTGRALGGLEPDGDGWRADGERFDAILLATPGRATASIVRRVAPDAAGLLDGWEHADVIMVRLHVAAASWPDRLRGHSGYLVPKPDQHLVTAASFASQKWAHWQPPSGGEILRVSLGRDGLPVMHLDDDDVVRATVDETGRHLGIDLQPDEVSITRWEAAFPQYRPHHHERVGRIERALPPTIATAGASQRGIGIPACIADGIRAATRVKRSMAGADDEMS